MAEDKDDQELESKIEAAVARALESQLPAFVAQLRKERPEQKAAGTGDLGCCNSYICVTTLPVRDDELPSGTHL